MKLYIIINCFITIFFITQSILFSQLQYSDLYSMLNDITPFEDEVSLNFLNVENNNDRVSSIFWFDQDSTRFTKLFHYDNNDQLYLISEFRETSIIKEIYFTSSNIADRFIRSIFGDNFYSNENYITEIVYNESSLPISYNIESSRNDYIGHIILNYNEHDHIIREAWFKGKRKIREFLK